jgi:hypothetical protein
VIWTEPESSGSLLWTPLRNFVTCKFQKILTDKQLLMEDTLAQSRFRCGGFVLVFVTVNDLHCCYYDDTISRRLFRLPYFLVKISSLADEP